MRKGRIGDAFCAVKAPAQSGGGLRRCAGRRMGVCPRRGRTGRPEAHGAGMAAKSDVAAVMRMRLYAYLCLYYLLPPFCCRLLHLHYCICVYSLRCRCIAVALQLRCRCIAVALQLHCRCAAVALPLRCRCIAVALQLHCRCAVCRIIYCGYPAHALLCPRCGAGNEAPQAAPWRRCPAL